MRYVIITLFVFLLNFSNAFSESSACTHWDSVHEGIIHAQELGGNWTNLDWEFYRVQLTNSLELLGVDNPERAANTLKRHVRSKLDSPRSRVKTRGNSSKDTFLNQLRSSPGVVARRSITNIRPGYIQVRPYGRTAPVEKLERFISFEEAKSTLDSGNLMPKANHLQNKWITRAGNTNASNLGKGKNYTHKMTLEVEPGTMEWLESVAELKSNEPGRFGIPPQQLEEFNRRLIRIKAEKRK